MTRSVELVVGADSTIGAALLQRLRLSGRAALGTSRRPTRDSSIRFLDMTEPPTQWDGPAVSVAYICAAVARLDACQRDPVGSARVNIAGACNLARTLLARGAFVVFLSTNQVFDGSAPYRRVDEAPTPLSEYGRQKATVEKQLLDLGAGISIVRLTKVLGPSLPLFDGWAKSLARGERVQPFSDMSMAPVPLGTVAEAIAAIGARRLAGMSHLSGERDVSYAECAQLLAAYMGAPSSLVAPVRARDANPNAEPPPQHTTLDLHGLPTKLGIEVPTVTLTILQAIERAVEPPYLAAAV